MASMRLRRRALLIATAGALLAPACLSPTLPLPPPGEPTVEPMGQNQYLLTGQVPVPVGRAEVINLRTTVIAGDQLEQGRYSIVVVARPDDVLRLVYTDGVVTSSFTEFVIEKLLPPGAISDGGGATDGAADAGP
jgi:hypothetical protein